MSHRADVLTSSNYYKNFFEESPKFKLQKELTEVICRIDQEKLLKNGLDHAHITDAEKIYMKELQHCKEGVTPAQSLQSESGSVRRSSHENRVHRGGKAISVAPSSEKSQLW